MFVHCKTCYGVHIVVGKYQSDVPLVAGADFKTGDVVDNNGGKNGVYTGTAVNGSVDGTIEKNYKVGVIEAINAKTDAIIAAGVNHNGVNFKVEMTDQINALGLFVQMLAGIPMAGQEFRAEGETYTFIDNTDFTTWFTLASNLIKDSVHDGAALKDQVTAAENTLVAMSPILAENDLR